MECVCKGKNRIEFKIESALKGAKGVLCNWGGRHIHKWLKSEQCRVKRVCWWGTEGGRTSFKLLSQHFAKRHKDVSGSGGPGGTVQGLLCSRHSGKVGFVHFLSWGDWWEVLWMKVYPYIHTMTLFLLKIQCSIVTRQKLFLGKDSV